MTRVYFESIPSAPSRSSIFGSIMPSVLLASVGLDDSKHLARRPLQVAVLHDVVEPGLLRQFLLECHPQSLLELRGILGASRAESPFELLSRRWSDEHEDGVGHTIADLSRALHVDLEQDIPARPLHLVDRPTEGPGAVAEHGGPLQERVLRDEPVELRLAHEPVIDALDFTAARGARLRRDREVQRGIARAPRFRGAPRAAPGWPGS